jgi:hypothetical protein
MTPEEIAALYSQEQGITPTLPPLNPMDLAMLGLSGPAEDTGLPPTLLQMVRYRKPGVSALAQEAAAAYHQKPRVDPIGSRATVFHATSPESAAEILRAGEIVPDAGLLDKWGLKKWNEARPLTAKAYPGMPLGVSVSRVPRVASKGTRAVSFVIDPEKMPPSRPFAEPDFGKTLENAWEEYPGQLGDSAMNPRFEFEDRTYNTAIPTSAVREMWVDKSALPAWKFLSSLEDQPLEQLQGLSRQYGIPMREFESGREMHAGRATLGSMAKKKR